MHKSSRSGRHHSWPDAVDFDTEELTRRRASRKLGLPEAKSKGFRQQPNKYMLFYAPGVHLLILSQSLYSNGLRI